MPEHRIYTSPNPAVPPPKPASLFHSHFGPGVSSYPDSHPVFVDALSGRTVNRGHLRQSALRIGKGLQSLHTKLERYGGLPAPGWQSDNPHKHSHVVLMFAPNSIEFPMAFYGIQAAGYIAALANSNYTPRELAHQIRDSTAGVCFVAPSHVETFVAARAELGGEAAKKVHGFVLVPEFEQVDAKQEAEWKKQGLKSYKDFWASESDAKGWTGVKKENGDEHHVAILCYSSGTTGLAKGVMTTHNNLHTVEQYATRYAFPEMSGKNGDRMAGVLPFYHIFGALNVLIQAVDIGVPVYVLPKFSLEDFLTTIQRYKITWSYVVPPIIVQLANNPIVKDYDVSSLKAVLSGAAPLGAGVVKKCQSKIPGIKITQGYGLTETSPITHSLAVAEADDHIGSIGTLIPTLQCRLIDLDGNDVEPGKPGELIFKGPSVMKGYWRNVKATENTFIDGWYRTGDIGQEENGYWFIVDRLKELIKYKGFQVPPADLEALLLTHPRVEDVGVVGIQDDDQGTELPRAYCVPAGGLASLKTAEDKQKWSKEIIDWVAKNAANHKRLRGGCIAIEAIPKSAAGKILRRELRDLAAKDTKKPSAKL